MSGSPEYGSFKDIDNALDEIDELLERWNNRLSVKDLRFAERYFNDRMELGLVYVRRAAPVGEQYCAVFNRNSVTGLEGQAREADRLVSEAGKHKVRHKDGLGMHRQNRDEESVLVDDVETVQLPKRFAAIRSTVRLQTIHQTASCRTDAVELLPCVLPELRPVPTYWEGRIIIGDAALLTNKSIGQEIEGGAKIVNTVTNNAAPLGVDSLRDPEPVDFVSSLRIYLDENAILISLPEQFDGLFKIIKVFFGPANLYADAY